MRKFLLILLFLPMVASLGHDVYIYQQNPDKGFRFWDLGALWDRYHKESHDQWKIKLGEVGNTVGALVPDAIKDIGDNPDPKETINEAKQAYEQSFEQTNENNKEVQVTEITEEKVTQTNISALQHFVGFVLEQKAVLVFAVIAFGVLFLNTVLKLLFRSKTARAPKKGKNAKGEYQFSRK